VNDREGLKVTQRHRNCHYSIRKYFLLVIHIVTTFLSWYDIPCNTINYVSCIPFPRYYHVYHVSMRLPVTWKNPSVSIRQSCLAR